MNRGSLLLSALAAAVAVALAGCRTTVPAYEAARRDSVAEIGGVLPPADTRPVFPPGTEPAQGDYLRFAMLNNPRVFAAYYDWRASVETITTARSLPDPKFTFEADIDDTIKTFMPGLMFDLFTSGKRAALGREAAARSGMAYREYVATVLGVAAEVRKAMVELAYSRDMLHLFESTIANVRQSLALAESGFATDSGMVALDEMVRLQNIVSEHHAHHDVLGTRISASRARLKAALGLARDDADPPWPDAVLAASALPPEAELWQSTLEANPGLGLMRAAVETAIAGVEVARRTATPDFSPGLMINTDNDPVMFRPTATVTLPIWRDKIAATIAAAGNRRDAAVARTGAEQLDLASRLAQTLFIVREADRMIEYIDGVALPRLERVVDSAGAAYQSGGGAVGRIPDTLHTMLNLQLERTKVLRERELAAADILILIAGRAPDGAPLLRDQPEGEG